MLPRPIVAATSPPATPAALRQRVSLETGRRDAALRATLTPRYGRVGRDIALGYAALAGVLALAGGVDGIVAGIAAAGAGAIGVGIVVAYLQRFVRDGAHDNLAATRADNDHLADWLICWLVGTSIAACRATHGEHCRPGGPDGTGPRRARHRAHGRQTSAAGRTPPLRGLYLHATLVLALLFAGAWPAVLAWGGGIAVVFPCVATIRRRLARHVTNVFGGGTDRRPLRDLEPGDGHTHLVEPAARPRGTSMRSVLDARPRRSTITAPGAT